MGGVKTTSILLALLMVLGIVSEAGAESGNICVEHNFLLEFGGQVFGFLDSTHYSGAPPQYRSVLHFGPLGSREVPFTAVQGLVGFGCILATLVTLSALFTVRWQREPGGFVKLRFCRHRLRLRFSLRALFIAITLVAIWLGYHVNWIRQRHEAITWLEQHDEAVWNVDMFEPHSWSLRLLGEGRQSSRSISPTAWESRDLTTFRKQLAKISALFPECEIYNRSTFDQ
jgi:hypothetical protein